jgi:sterol desaturase/sphingolipid hydroxylase (fatty acid hydroxylase superfamily)
MEAALRLGVFLGVFALTGLLELALPRRPKAAGVGRRWLANLGILAVDVLVQRLTVGAVAIAAAVWAEAQGLGVLNLTGWPGWLEGLLAFLALDCAVWAQHVATHKVPLLWRLHQVHHADHDVDLTTGVRFHPLEIVLSALFKAALVVALGAPAAAVLLFEAVLNASAVFTHSNVALPERLDRALRWVVCTPDMHRVHHSTERAEHDTNYGFFLSVWDRSFRTMRHAPAAGQLGVELGLAEHRDPARLGLLALLLMPFHRRPRRAAPVGGRSLSTPRPVAKA